MAAGGWCGRGSRWHYCAVIELARVTPWATWPGAAARPRHAREWVLALALVLAGHALILGGVPVVLDAGDGVRLSTTGATGTVLVVRTLEPGAQGTTGVGPANGAGSAGVAPQPDLPALPAWERTPVQASPPAPAQPATPTAALPSSTTVSPTAPVTPPVATASLQPAASPLPREPGLVPDAGRVGEAEDAVGDPAGAQVYAGPVPQVWNTRLPGDFAAHYLLQRGSEPARAATLRFEAGQGRYTLQLLPAAGGRGPEQTSQGRMESTGLAPERYLDRRQARAAAAANFDRGRSRISYSGAPVEQPLFAGTQDRLSWIVQLAGIVDADPARWQAHARLPLYVTGARGDAQLWVFTVKGHQAVEGPSGAVQELLHLVREPERPYDVRVEAWLDPAHQHLPARLQLSPVPAGRPLRWSRVP